MGTWKIDKIEIVQFRSDAKTHLDKAADTDGTTTLYIAAQNGLIEEKADATV